MGEFGLSSTFEGIEEFSQDVIDANALGDEIDREALKWSFLVGSASGGIYHAGGSALKSFGARANKYVNDRILSARAEETQKQLDALIGAIANTKTASRVPEAMEDFIRQTSDGKIGSVWIDGRKLAEFAQAEDEASIDALREELGVAPEDAEAFAEALATGTDVELDAAKLYTKIGTESS